MRKKVFYLLCISLLCQSPAHGLTFSWGNETNSVTQINSAKNKSNNKKKKLVKKIALFAAAAVITSVSSSILLYLFLNKRDQKRQEDNKRFQELQSRVQAIEIPTEGSYQQLSALRDAINQLEVVAQSVTNTKHKQTIAKEIAEKDAEIVALENQASNEQMQENVYSSIIPHGFNQEVFTDFFTKQFVNPNLYISDFGMYPLEVACEQGNLPAIKELLKQEADVNIQDHWGRTPLAIACLNNRVDLVSILLEHNADVNQADNNGITPFHYALINDNNDIIEKLLEINKSNVNIDTIVNSRSNDTYNGCTPIHIAMLKIDEFNQKIVSEHKSADSWEVRERNFYIRLVKKLMIRGDLTIENLQGERPGQLAKRLNIENFLNITFVED
jgi:hypothetical protein